MVAGAAAYGLLIVLLLVIRPPILRLAMALVFAAPAGFALIHGITREAVPSEIWRQIFCSFIEISRTTDFAAYVRNFATGHARYQSTISSGPVHCGARDL